MTTIDTLVWKRPYLVYALIILIGLSLLIVSGNSRVAYRRSQMVALIGHNAADIPETVQTINGVFAGEWLTESEMSRDLSWFSPQPHIPFKYKVVYYRLGGLFGAGSVIIYIDKQDIVYAIHFVQDAVPTKR
jgi:hypothetical protein